MAKAGYFGGDPTAVIDAPVNIVMAILDYESFTADYEAEYLALNKD